MINFTINGSCITNKTTTGSNSVETTKNIVSTGTIASKEEL